VSRSAAGGAQVVKLDMATAERAAARLRRFRFVGLLEDWTETLKDFLWFNARGTGTGGGSGGDGDAANIELDEMLTAVHRWESKALSTQACQSKLWKIIAFQILVVR